VDEALVRSEGLGKSFGGVPVLQNLDFAIGRGEILGLVGENGAGKSTLMKILAGIHRADRGSFTLEGRTCDFRSPAEARRAGVSLVPQEFNLVEDLSVEENVFLGSELLGPGGLVDRRTMRAKATRLLAELKAEVGPDARIARLSAARKQLVEVAKALAFDARLLIMDEPTTVLTRREIASLFALVRRLRSEGMTVVYISHKLDEVKELCDRLLVLRDGVLVHEAATKDIETHEIAARMVGRELREIFPPKAGPGAEISNPPLLELRGLSSPPGFAEVSFSLRRGEILGLAGLMGAGRSEVAEALMGLRPSAGAILLEGSAFRPSSPREAVASGLGYLSEDRQGSGVLTAFSLAHNVTLTSLPAYARTLGLVDFRREEGAARRWIERFGIKASSIAQRLENLSGGNQQKVSLAKTLDAAPKVLIVDEPTRGVDVAAKQEIYRFLAELAAEGTAILLVSSELEEILGMCTRVVVMREGRVAGELSGGGLDERAIMYLATGVGEGSAA